MNNLDYPIKFSFKVTTLSNDFTARNAQGQTIAYVKQKMFKLKEAVNVYSDESKTRVLFTIAANKWLDWSAAYSMMDANNKEIGKIARKGWRSMWKAEYNIIDQNQQPQYNVKEQSAFTRFLDNLLGEIPILGFFTGYLFNPTYDVTNSKGEVVVKLKKMPSFLGKEFELTKHTDIDEDDKERVMLGLMMMILLERRRG
ncbi:hypothetical protein JCM19275_553 [Nonlabens ulvanivorans]|uniref:Uncharacterized protein n=1 Tax=Nonlabens ulvanivorans TaxID=906888 RepID=A0A081DG51_NONUL|nr:hypothetical protein [Nonlabens ulvanivorans]GAK77897.1 hypothetical protein JCM19296_3506 [Nonlabens ulvanivorans]GAL76897.1 hypothetical protein JCM19275_553 [Nonlabens ulvanivorans]